MFEAPKREIPNIGLTPLIDVVFILLIFVVLAANFDRIRGLKVDLPEASSKYKPKQTKSLVLSIAKDGGYHIEKRKIASGALRSTLQSLRKKHKILLLKADGKAALQHAVRVLDIAAALKFESVSIATKRPAP